MTKQVQPIIVRRRKTEAHPHHGGAWKVAYADFVTAMMAFFMVMWLVNQDPSVKKAIAGYFRDPGAFPTQASNGILPGGREGVSSDEMAARQERRDPKSGIGTEQKSMSQAAEKIKGALQETPEVSELRDQVEMSITSEGLRIELVDKPGSSFFASGSAALLGESVKILSVITHEITKLDNDVIVEGHTDSKPYGIAAKYGNWELSSDRANAARRVMEAGGLAPARIRAVYGHADTQPHIVSDPLDPRNRRVSILVRSKYVEQLNGVVHGGDAFNPMSRPAGEQPRPGLVKR